MNFQSVSGQQGRLYEDQCRAALHAAGFAIDQIHQEIAEAGVDVDIIATNRHDISFYMTCKGSLRGVRPGARRTDTLKKALAEAWALQHHGWGPVLLLTSHLPRTPRARALLATGLAGVLFDAVQLVMAPLLDLQATPGYRRLAWLADAPEADLCRDLAERRLALPAPRRRPAYAPWVGRLARPRQLSLWQELAAQQAPARVRAR